MSLKILANILDFGPSEPIERFILLILANWCDDLGIIRLPPSTAEIARQCCQTPSAIEHSLRSLEINGWIRVSDDPDDEYICGINTEKLESLWHDAYVSQRCV